MSDPQKLCGTVVYDIIFLLSAKRRSRHSRTAHVFPLTARNSDVDAVEPILRLLFWSYVYVSVKMKIESTYQHVANDMRDLSDIARNLYRTSTEPLQFH